MLIRAHRRSRFAAAVAVLVSAVVVLAGCATTVQGHGTIRNAPDAKLPVVGGTGGAFDTDVRNALSDVMAFWKKEYPKIADGRQLPPLKGGLYSVDGAQVEQKGFVEGPASKERCIASNPEFIVDNAAFCPADDSIVWDRAPNHLFAQLADHYGPLLVGLIFAHEFGHAISYRLGVFSQNLPTIDTESQADCAAGAWAGSVLAHQDPHFRNVTPSDIDDALEGFLDGRDSTPGTIAEISHGNGFDRLSAVADGIDRGASYCFSPNYFDRTFTERPFSTQAEYNSGGNQPLAATENPHGAIVQDLNRFFTGAAQSVHKTFEPVTIKRTTAPTCTDAHTSDFFYCPATNTIEFAPRFAHSAYYSLPDISANPSTGDVQLLFNQPADFALGELFAVGWGLAVRHQLFARTMDTTSAVLAAVCYSGAYAKDVNIAHDPTGTRKLTLSPSDLDEAVSALLNQRLQDESLGQHGTTGLDRIQAFVKGYNGGLGGC